jgi:hypothetical protein
MINFFSTLKFVMRHSVDGKTSGRSLVTNKIKAMDIRKQKFESNHNFFSNTGELLANFTSRIGILCPEICLK